MQIIINITLSFSLYLLIAVSFAFQYRTAKFLNFSFAILLSLSAYILFLFSTILNISMLLSILFTVIITIFTGIISYRLIFFPLKNRNIPSWQMLIASLGIYLILQNLISIFFGDDTKSFRTWEIKEGHQLLGAYITDVQITIIIVSIILLLFIWFFIEKTRIGKQINAVSSNSEMSSILGISKEKAILWSFGLGSGLASIAGILIAADTDITPTMGFNWLLYAIIAMIIGGMGKMRYLFMGALLLASSQHLSAYYLDSKWLNATAFIILIVFLFFKPYGFSGKKLKKAEL